MVQAVAEEGPREGRELSRTFLGHMVKLARPVAKLVWFAKDMAASTIHLGGLDTLVDLTTEKKDVDL